MHSALKRDYVLYNNTLLLHDYFIINLCYITKKVLKKMLNFEKNITSSNIIKLFKKKFIIKIYLRD